MATMFMSPSSPSPSPSTSAPPPTSSSHPTSANQQGQQQEQQKQQLHKEQNEQNEQTEKEEPGPILTQVYSGKFDFHEFENQTGEGYTSDDDSEPPIDLLGTYGVRPGDLRVFCERNGIYSWSQTNDIVMLSVPVPANTKREDVLVELAANEIKVVWNLRGETQNQPTGQETDKETENESRKTQRMQTSMIGTANSATAVTSKYDGFTAELYGEVVVEHFIWALQGEGESSCVAISLEKAPMFLGSALEDDEEGEGDGDVGGSAYGNTMEDELVVPWWPSLQLDQVGQDDLPLESDFLGNVSKKNSISGSSSLASGEAFKRTKFAVNPVWVSCATITSTDQVNQMNEELEQALERDTAAAEIQTKESSATKLLARLALELGKTYALGIGNQVPDYKIAVKFLQIAFEHKSEEAAALLALVYEKGGYGVEKDDTAVCHWWKEAATTGDAYAIYSLGVVYMTGHGCVKDVSLANNFFVLANQLDSNFDVPNELRFLETPEEVQKCSERRRKLHRLMSSRAFDASELVERVNDEASTGIRFSSFSAMCVPAVLTVLSIGLLLWRMKRRAALTG